MARIALVDASASAEPMVAGPLAARGHDVERIWDFESALALVDDPPDLVITEVDLPGGSGLELIAQLRGVHAPERLPVLVVSARGAEVDLLRGFAAGADDYLTKPVALGTLLGKCARYLRAAATPADPDATAVLVRRREGPRFGRYRVTGTLGRGAFGAVYEAEDLVGGGWVALKVLHDDVAAQPEARLRFLREIYLVAELRHPHLVRVVDFGNSEGEVYLAMERVVGPTLQGYVLEEGPLDEAAAVALLRALTGALGELAAARVVHRDIKPANLLLRDGDPRQPVLIDFGLSKRAFDRGVTSPGLLLGTPGYLAPELLGTVEPDHRADLFALGVVVRYALTGCDPHPDLAGFEVLRAMARSPLDLPPDLGAPLRQALSALLEPDPDRRVQTAADLLARLEGAP